jgi:hypothetical protein
MKEAIIAGLISGILSPLILSWLQHNIIWRKQKRYEIKYSVFSDAVRAMSQYETDVLDFEIQENKKTYKDPIKRIELRPETSSVIEKTRGMVMAFFSKDTFQKYEKVFKAKISIENIPNIEFEKRRNEAIIAMAQELGIDSNSLFSALTSRWRGLHKKSASPLA